MMKALGFIFAFLLAIPLGGFTIATLWGWFIVPLGVPAIGIAHGCGIAMFIGYFKGHRKEIETEEDWSAVIARAFATPPVFLGTGFLIHLVMGL